MTKDSLPKNPEYSLDLEEGVFPVDIEKAVKAGVKVFVMCYHGYGTSVSFAEVLRDAGESGGTRTHDTLLKRQML